MKILYDGHIFGGQYAGGMSRYFQRLIQELPLACEPTLMLSRMNLVARVNHPRLQIYRFPRLRPTRIFYRLEKKYFARLTRRKYDLFHPSNYVLLSDVGFDELRSPLIVTLYDMMHEIFPHDLDPTGHDRAAKRRAVENAAAVLCISHHTKKDLLERLKVDESKIFVTHLATDFHAAMGFGDEDVPSRPYFLYVGGRQEHKNFARLLGAFKQLTERYPEVALCAVGVKLSSDEQQLLNHYCQTDNFRLYEQISDEHLAKLYRHCIAHVYPSLYEGFGIPPLEAMTCGAPVVASNAACIPEVCGDAALYFNPYSTEELAVRLEQVMTDTELRERLVAAGQARVRNFSWSRMVAETVEIYRQVVGKSVSG